jgi:hypothetical protein
MSLRVWQGNINHQASNPANWSPNGAPQSGDALLMTSGVMHIGGKDLADDTLTVNLATPNPSQGGSAELDLAHGAVVSLTAHTNGGMLHTIGGTLQFIDSSDFSAYSTVLNSNLTGNGTLGLTGANHHGETMEVNGTVDKDLTFVINRGGAPDATLQIDRPDAFQALIDLSAMTTNDFIGLGHIGLNGIHATGGSFQNGTLTLTDEDGATVDTLRIKGGTGLQAWQSDTGVMLTAAKFNDVALHGINVTPIPLDSGA